ncbi:AraC family transcriptional regulator [Parafrankia sp. BMG5.11]|uniref:helix-turn-helix transcriptional regulator n=1 Tax=Parafrankia sp. BMG5.11 TaxID=222540 RepID=UPI00140545CA|nr:AraC family transcriptional regulator [Parafrankia sp. BMG5.11]
MDDIAPVSILEARSRPDLIVRSIVTPLAIFEICRFPAVRNESLEVTEKESLLSLGLSRIMPDAGGRTTRGYGRFMPMGGLNFRPRRVPLEFNVGGPPFHTVRGRFDDQQLAAAGLNVTSLSSGQLEACLDIHSPRVEESMMRIAEEVDAADSDSERLVGALAAVVVTDLARYLATFVGDSLSRTGGIAPRKLRLVCEHMDRPGKPATLEELAGLCGLSRFHFVRAFRQSTGCPPAAYAQKLRMNRARRLLATDMAIAEVAAELGYRGASAFSAAFRRDSGRSPIRWRAGLH